MQVQLLVWIFVMRIMMVVASGVSYLINDAIAKARYANADKMNFEAPLTFLVWLTSILSVVLTYIVSYLMIPDLGDGTLWWKLSSVITCGTLAGAIIPEFVKVFTSTESRHVKEVVTSSREGGPSLNILSGLVAGNFSAYWLGITIMVLMSVAYLISNTGLGTLMVAPAVFAFGLVAFGFLGMGPVTIAVDSYGPVTDNAQSVFELSTIEQMPDAPAEIQARVRLRGELREGEALPRGERRRRQHVQGDGEAGAHRHGGRRRDDDDLLDHRGAHGRAARRIVDNLSILHPPFLLGLITGGAIIYWFTGASMQAVTTGAYRAVEFIKANMNLDEHRGRVGRGQQEGRRDLHEVRAEGHVQHLPHGVLRDARVRVRRAVLLHRLPDLDRAVRSVSGDLHGERRRRLGQREEDRRSRVEAERHAAPCRDGRRRHGRRSVQGHVVGRAQPDHQVHDAVRIARRRAGGFAHRAERSGPRATRWPRSFFVISVFFVYRSFYGMRIESK